LDLPAIAWLEDKLRASQSALVVISHDRRFLETVTNDTVWIDRGVTRRAGCGFRDFEAWRDKFLEEEEAALHKLGRKIAAEEDWMRYGVTARRKRNMRRVRELADLRKQKREHRGPQGTAKLAATEAFWNTNGPGEGAAWSIFAWPDAENERNAVEFRVPYVLSQLATHDPYGRVVGLKDIPRDERPPIVLIFYSFRIMVITGSLTDIVFRTKLFQVAWIEALRRLVNLPRSNYGTWLAHIGLGFMVIGIVSSLTWRQEHAAKVKNHETILFAGYGLTFEKAGNLTGPNYLESAATFTLRGMPRSASNDDGQPKVIPPAPMLSAPLATLTTSQRRFLPASGMPTTETAIYRAWLGDYYIALSEIGKDGHSATVRVYFNPLVRLIWYGGLLMAIGAVLSLLDRRLRIGAPVRKRQRDIDKAATTSEATAAANASNIAEQST
ncbi:MAG: cytochrome c-type biogenesis CcmF C-terminal domain-containing protein, partial [Alphaproteobacteria bacterium]